jgi:glycosyltransferase involved in cell wall biosynthesis
MSSLRSHMSKKPAVIKVLQVGDFPPPAGGVATHVEELFKAVRAMGGESQVLDIGKGQLPAEGVRGAGSLASFAAQLTAKAARGYRIHLHTNGANPKSWMLAQACAAAGTLSGGALITLHSGLGPAWLMEKASRRTAARAILSQFRSVIAVSRPIRDALEQCGVHGALVLPAFSPESVKPGSAPAGLAELRARAKVLFCAMVAPRPEYGEALLLSAFAQVRHEIDGAFLALYGPDSDDARGDGVLAFGELLRPEALALMAACDVFVRPTLADGDSVSVREAIALGRTVVASDVGTRPAEARLVPPGDATALSHALIAAAREGSAGPARDRSSKAADAFSRILSLYGFTEDRCAASAVS